MTKKISILKAIKAKPSIALEMMIKGLKRQSKRDDFVVHMGTYGASENGICYGCAATCTIQEIANKNIYEESIYLRSNRANELNFKYDELDRFEDAIDEARGGVLDSLFIFCNKDKKFREEYNNGWDVMHNHNWNHQIPKVKRMITKLKKVGL